VNVGAGALAKLSQSLLKSLERASDYLSDVALWNTLRQVADLKKSEGDVAAGKPKMLVFPLTYGLQLFFGVTAQRVAITDHEVP